MTPFRAILRRAVETTPHAVGGAFADSEGEMVDCFATIDAFEWAVLTAHYGVIFAQLNAIFGMWHYGGPEYFIAQHKKLEVFVHAVDAGYYAVLAFDEPANLSLALSHLGEAATALRREMA